MIPLSRAHAAWVGVVVLVCSILFAGQWRRHARPRGPVTLTRAAPVSGAVASTTNPTGSSATIYVHVAGQVLRPGLYPLRGGSRVMDAITAAGGKTLMADLDALNLATPLRDGQKLMVPALGEPAPIREAPTDFILDSPGQESPLPYPDVPATQPYLAASVPPAWQMETAPVAPVTSNPPSRVASSSSSGDKLRNPGDGVVNINTASERELTRLPGVGPSTARKILEYRSQHGGFRTVDELMEVRGIGEVKLERMRPFVVL